jgi:hypothetical protein
MRSFLALALALLALQSSALKLRIEPYASECVTEVATIDGDRVCAPSALAPVRAPRGGSQPRLKRVGSARARLQQTARSLARATDASRAIAAASTGSFVGTAEGAYRTARNFFDLEVKSEDGTTLHTVRNRQDAKFEFVVPRAGRFTACIRNYGRHAADVTYHSFVGHKVEHDKLTSDHLGPLRNSLGTMRNTLRQLLEEQLYQENRDTMHSQSACASVASLCQPDWMPPRSQQEHCAARGGMGGH